jgi:hypothetical protein
MRDNSDLSDVFITTCEYQMYLIKNVPKAPCEPFNKSKFVVNTFVVSAQTQTLDPWNHKGVRHQLSYGASYVWDLNGLLL